MKNLFAIFLILFVGTNSLKSQSCFELIIEPTITSTTATGELLTLEFRIFLNNTNIAPDLELHTMQNAIGLSDSITSYVNFSGVSKVMTGGQVVVQDTTELLPPVNYLGQDFTSWLVYGHTVSNSGTSLPQVILQGDTDELAKLTLNFDGTQKFTDDPVLATPEMPYILDSRYFVLFPGKDNASIPGVVNTFGSVLPNGFPIALNCYDSKGATCAFANQPCDDGDINTLNDKIDASCNCVGTPINVVQQICQSISTSDDDVEQNNSDNSMELNNAELQMVEDGNGGHLIGLRFSNINIPQGAIITEAYLQFTTSSSSTGASNLLIEGELVEDAAAYSSISNDIGGRLRTDSSVVWNPSDWGVPGERATDQQSPDIKGVVQQIVDQDGFLDGNAMSFIISGTGMRNAVSYDSDPDNSAELCISYKVCHEDLILDSSLNSVSGTFEATNSIVLQGPLDVETGGTLILKAPNIIVKDNVNATLGGIEVDKNGCQ